MSQKELNSIAVLMKTKTKQKTKKDNDMETHSARKGQQTGEGQGMPLG